MLMETLVLGVTAQNPSHLVELLPVCLHRLLRPIYGTYASLAILILFHPYIRYIENFMFKPTPMLLIKHQSPLPFSPPFLFPTVSSTASFIITVHIYLLCSQDATKSPTQVPAPTCTEIFSLPCPSLSYSIRLGFFLSVFVCLCLFVPKPIFLFTTHGGSYSSMLEQQHTGGHPISELRLFLPFYIR